jgi:CRP/FNR family transcriptional regulator
LTVRASPYAFERPDSCATCSWRARRFFCDLDSATLQDFQKLGFTNVYPPGSVLYSEGQQPHGIFSLCTGRVKLSLTAGDGRTLIAHIASPGEVLGLSSNLTGNPFKATAETLEVSHVHFVRRDDFLRLVLHSHALSSNAVRQLSVECETEADHIRTLGLAHSAAEKLASLILRWCESHGRRSEDGVRVQMLMTQEDISQLIGTSRETVSRLLKDLRAKNILTIRGSALTVHDAEALRALVAL